MKLFIGKSCAEYNLIGSIIQENSNNCSGNNLTVSCPEVYVSTDAFKCMYNFTFYSIHLCQIFKRSFPLYVHVCLFVINAIVANGNFLNLQYFMQWISLICMKQVNTPA